MKKAILIWILIIRSVSAWANEIDSLKTIRDVEQFLQNRAGINTDGKMTGFFKMDIDNNGLTDLVINMDFCFALLDTGDGYYERRSMYMGDGCIAIDTLHVQDVSLLVVKNSENIYANGVFYRSIKNDTLIWKFGDFIEYNGKPDQLKIEEINFYEYPSATMSAASAELEIDASKKMRYTNYSVEAATIDTASYNKLIQTMNYIKLASLRDSYRIEGADMETVGLEIKYNNGRIKTISDYGGCGTFGLKNLYRQLYDVLEKSNWQK